MNTVVAIETVVKIDAEPSVTSTEMLRQAQANNQQAWQQMVELYSRRMYRWCRCAGLQSADAGNVVQEVFESVARKLGDFRRDRPGDSFRGWLRRITDNKIRDFYRRQQRALDTPTGGTDAQQRLHQLAKSDDSIEIEVPTWDTLQLQSPPVSDPLLQSIEQVRGKISERDWRLFWRVAVDGQPATEVAEEFHLTANAVRLVKMRVLRKLRQSLPASSP